MVQSACLGPKQCLVLHTLLIQRPSIPKLDQGISSINQVDSVQEQFVQCGESRLLMWKRYDAPAMQP